jgi:hypothetical protein
MAFTIYAGSINPGYTIRFYIQFNNYQYIGPKVIQALPHWQTEASFLITSDLGQEKRVKFGGSPLHLYSVAVRNVGDRISSFSLVGGDVV